MSTPSEPNWSSEQHDANLPPTRPGLNDQMPPAAQPFAFSPMPPEAQPGAFIPMPPAGQPQPPIYPGPPGYFGPPGHPVYYAPPRPTNGMAVASMVLGILWLYWIGSILALIFGYVARQQIRERGDGGDGMAIAGIVLGWVGVGILAVGVVIVVIVGSTTGFSR